MRATLLLQLCCRAEIASSLRTARKLALHEIFELETIVKINNPKSIGKCLLVDCVTTGLALLNSAALSRNTFSLSLLLES